MSSFNKYPISIVWIPSHTSNKGTIPCEESYIYSHGTTPTSKYQPSNTQCILGKDDENIWLQPQEESAERGIHGTNLLWMLWSR